MQFVLTYNNIEIEGDPLQFAITSSTLDLQIGSGGTFPANDARITISTSVPESYTLDFTILFEKLPADFNDLVNRHIFFGISDAAGYCAGLFFSKLGFAYTGSIHHTSGSLPNQNLVLDSVVQPLPGSDLLISEGEYYSFRIAVDGETGTTYIFVTKTADLPSLGYQLKFVLPGIPSSSCAITPPDRTYISVRGTPGAPSIVDLDSICAGTGLIIPNLPPVADAGSDQAVRTCEIIQLDGSKSYDPEGATLTYQWRLVDAPIGSMFMLDGLDGVTLTTGTGFTNKFYSVTLSLLDQGALLQLGSVLVVAGAAFTIEAKGTDGNGFYVQVQGVSLTDPATGIPFKLLPQNGISGPTTAKPTFYPDLPGFYKFDLIVSDGQLLSDPSVTLVSVNATAQPRGCIPDVSFIWNYLSDFWSLIDDRQPIETLWGAVAQVTAAELFSLWQIDYSKSLRDVQRTFQRRWLHYDLSLQETLPQAATLRAVLNGMRQVFPSNGIPIPTGSVLTIVIPVAGVQRIITFPALPVQVGNAGPLAQDVANFLTPVLATIDARFAVRVTTNRLTGDQELRIDAPFTFSNVATDTAPIFQFPSSNAMPAGSGAGVGVKSYKVDRTLQFTNIQEGDLLNLGDVCYRIARVIDDPNDEWPFQRVTLLDPLPNVVSSTWQMPGQVTSQSIDFYNALVWVNDLFTFEIFNTTSSLQNFVTIPGAFVVPAAPQSVGVDLTSVVNYMLAGQFEVTFFGFQRLNYIPIDPLVADIPYLQEYIKNADDTAVLRRNLDFYIDTYRGAPALVFAFGGFGSQTDIWQDPGAVPQRLWAEITYIDNKPIIEQNFGIPAEFTLDDLSQLPANSDYLSIVRGLWFAYFNGPTLFNLRVGTQILLGLPFAEEAGIIKEIRTDFSPNQGRLLVQDQASPEIIRSYNYPNGLTLEVNPATGQPYVVGDSVAQFAPLVTGATVVDYVKDPTWMQGYVEQGAMFEVEKFFRFMVRVDSPAFSLTTLLFVKSFILRIKPTYTYPMFIVLRQVEDTEVSATDEIGYSGTLLLFDGACTGDATMGMATMWDQPRAAFGGWRNQYDSDANPTTVPVYPTPEHVEWGFDKKYLCPEDFIEGSVCVTWAGGTPTYDSIFAFDTVIYQSGAYIFSAINVEIVPNDGTGTPLLYNPTTVTANGTLTDLSLTITGGPGSASPNYTLVISKNGSTVVTEAITVAGDPFTYHVSLTIPVLTGDQLALHIKPTGGVDALVHWPTVVAELGVAVAWAFDTSLAAGTYCVYKTL